jgi:lysophospholipase L1-like esterase
MTTEPNIVNTKSEGNPKLEIRNPKPAAQANCRRMFCQSTGGRASRVSDFGFRISGFLRTSAFGFRTSASLALLAPLGVLLAGCQTAPPNSLATHSSTKWEKEIAAFVASDRTNPPPQGGIVFVGSSSIRLWTNLVADFPSLPVVNRGFGGSQLADSVKFAEQIIIPYAPRQIVIYAGGNDLNAGKSPAVVYGDFVALATVIRARLPDTRIAYISSAPNPKRWEQVANVKQLNSLVEAYCHKHGLIFINVFPRMLGANGQPRPELYVADRLHMTPSGYALWKEMVGPCLK